ncbi:P-loop containing nucleoside triphosphate hydrolase protein [Apiospora rasikravindrae]|uniref:ATP-dependent RNA helicase ROK1 n=1 Tax=Apiospora rasikravindrae TaxID=990691 RepID=A0ABR1SI83_9PEZI
MDLLKVLSRGTKKSAKPEKSLAPPPKPTNPQLYTDFTIRGTKRKADEALTQTASAVADDLDFFAPKDTTKPAPAPAKDEEKPAKKQATSAPPPMSHDEIYQILKGHKLKFTILSSHEENKSKKQKVEVKAVDAKQSLYPRPLTSFNELKGVYNVSARLVANLAEHGYRLPTEVQMGSLPLLLNPKSAVTDTLDDADHVNFLAVAPTGSGKTLSFLIPTINRILGQRQKSKDKGNKQSLDAIVLAPTRELAHQIATEGQKLAAGTGVKLVLFKKGMRVAAEASDIEVAQESDSESDVDEEDKEESDEENNEATTSQAVTKADILVTTPMLLLNFLNREKTKKLLPTVRTLILDEGDVLLDELFREQTQGILASCTSESLQLMCFSATMGSNIETLLVQELEKRKQGESSASPLVRLVVGLKDTAVKNINHRLIYTGDNERGKLYTMRQLLHPTGTNEALPDMNLPFLVFVQTIDRATSLHDELKFEFPVEAGGSTRIAALHSSMSETARSKIIARFRAGEIWVLITTDLLMRGIDFRGVNGVINYDIPTSVAGYVHRVGRTARAGGAGDAVTMYTKEDIPFLRSIANVITLSEKQAGKDGNQDAVPKWLMDALPKVKKEDRQKLKKSGVESRRGTKAQITSKSAWERRRENNKKGAIAGSRRRGHEDHGDESEGQESEWGGLD